MQAMTLTEFLTARLDEDAAVAQKARPAFFTIETLSVFASSSEGSHVIRHDPARVLAEVDAKRRIVELHEGLDPDSVISPNRCAGCEDLWPCPTLRLLALPYAKHPDYQQEWKP